MKILFCNITYMKKYVGITDDDMTTKGGAWVEKNKDAHEQWNFLNVDGCCYGFVMNTGDCFAIERIDKEAARADELEDVTIVWCALNKEGETVVVGWYEHATVYRNYMRVLTTPLYGIDRTYFCVAEAEDCYLLPEAERTFRIGRASTEGKGRGFGQNHFWYAESAYARKELIPQVVEFLETHKQNCINLKDDNFAYPENKDVPLTAQEEEVAEELLNCGEYLEFLPYGYRRYFCNRTADNAYNIAQALCGLHQYYLSLVWHRTVVEIEGETWENFSCLPYLYQQCGMFEESAECAIKLLMYDEAKEPEVKHELFGVIADDNMYLGNIEEAINWLDKIIAESNNAELVRHTISVKENWSNF